MKKKKKKGKHNYFTLSVDIHTARASWIRNREMLKSNNGRSEAAERASKQAKVLAKTFPFKRVHGCVCVRYVDNLFALISIADDALQLFFRSSCKLFSN